MAAFQIVKNDSGQFFFHLRATGNNEIILQSEGYSAKASCISGIESVKTNAADDSKYSKLESKNGQCYFTLKAANGEVIGMSEMYSSASNRDHGIELVKGQAPNADVVDMS
jgi:uncharacterized protein YegP (UPF0339 family)